MSATQAAEDTHARAALACAALIAVLLALLLAVAAARDSGLTHGDIFSDSNVIIAGRNYDRHGLLARNGLPVQETCAHGDRPSGLVYTHYPPGPEWLHQAAKALGASRLAHFRLISVGASLAAAGLAFLAFRQAAGAVGPAALATLLMMASAPFLALADALHQHAWRQLTLFAFVLAWLRDERDPGGPWGRRAVAAAFADSWLSLEQTPVIVLFAAARTLPRLRKRLGRLLTVAAMPVIVLGLRLLLNSSVLGGLEAAVLDLWYSEGRDPTIGAVAVLDAWKRRLGFGGGFDREFELPLLRPLVALPALALAVSLAAGRGSPAGEAARRGVTVGLQLLLGAVAWSFCFRIHTTLHPQLTTLVMPGVALLLGSLAAHGVFAPAGRGRGLAVAAGLTLVSAPIVMLHDTVAFNRLMPVDASIVAELNRRAEGARRAAVNGQQLRDRDCVVFEGNVPYLAQSLDAPFEYLESRVPDADADPADWPLELEPAEALWVEAWTQPQSFNAHRAIERYGFPMPLSIEGQSLVFDGRGQPGIPLQQVSGSERLEAMRIEPSLTEEGWSVQFLLTSVALDTPMVALRVTPLGAGATQSVRELAAGVSSRDRVLLRLLLPWTPCPARLHIEAVFRDGDVRRLSSPDALATQVDCRARPPSAHQIGKAASTAKSAATALTGRE